MGKGSKSRRFSQQSADSVKKHAERFPYRSTFTEAERKAEETDNHTLGGF
ncbi:hypothetical protein [Virgibacillus halodenitrificans]|uniref:Competence protein n=1 Tax=Virgibacillus halodenitrificans TaxID=1482 RepID=A0ABR7VIL3_VIRHA|nr:hypothetical protein [Virgibacillus halodenitrificans]MBD1221773.1 hypothetical protein [Virgibacillus halodenitrificans]MCG1030161.1 hypothetical protein [Virgibacillus halodenitrificans]MCJ0932308.1 hypothetical protein [Virgibacillus halodenitrificans]MEC2158624.1 hypothetical protein [Virgibacillus halodenitrificans]WHX24697.1 hypothetical protein QNH47_10890 [Virgibacillus halodenitrificans]